MAATAFFTMATASSLLALVAASAKPPSTKGATSKATKINLNRRMMASSTKSPGFCSDNPAEFSSLVIGYAPCACEKTGLSDTSIFVAPKIECDQARILTWLSVNHAEACPRQRDDDAVILNLDAEPDGFSHA